MKLSVAIITHNEERIIERTLKAISDIADEILIVDSFSTDGTKTICQQFPKVKFIEHSFEGFGPQKNFALSQCSGDWVLFLDADEIPDEKAKEEIRLIIAQDKPAYKVYSIKFNNIFLGKTLKHGGWGNVKRERFFLKSVARYSDDIVHELFLTEEPVGELKGHLNHYTYKDIFHHIEKSNTYTSMMAKKMYERGKKSSTFKIIFSPKFQFFKCYVLRGGFKDGLVGYYAAKTSEFYTFLKYKKLYEMHHIR